MIGEALCVYVCLCIATLPVAAAFESRTVSRDKALDCQAANARCHCRCAACCYVRTEAVCRRLPASVFVLCARQVAHEVKVAGRCHSSMLGGVTLCLPGLLLRA